MEKQTNSRVLKGMTDFVKMKAKEVKEGESEYNAFAYCEDMSEFLRQTLELGHFIECDKDGNILKGKPLSPANDSEWIRWENEEFDFYKAKDKVLFEGWEVKEAIWPENAFELKYKDIDLFYVPDEGISIKYLGEWILLPCVEDLQYFCDKLITPLVLTETAAKEIN